MSCPRNWVLLAFLLSVILAAAEPVRAGPAAVEQVPAGRGRNLDAHWRFTRGDPAGAERPSFQDSAWQALDLPHDWSIEGPIDRNNATGPRGGFLPAGIGWYRKQFTLDEADAGKQILIQFDGVTANSDIYINGYHAGHRPYGWVTFQYDLTGHVTFGANRPNVLAVRVDNSRQPASRFYEGAGIYRHVWISIVDPVHLAQGGVYVTTPSVSAEQATVTIATTIESRAAADRVVTVRARVTACEETACKRDLRVRPTDAGRTRRSILQVQPAATEFVAAPATATVGAGRTAELTSSCVIRNPELWDPDHPRLYRAAIEVVAGEHVIDSQTVCFGIREAVFRSDSGFWLNGRNLKLLGACVHSDGGAFGTAVPDSVWERRLATLKSIGVNAVRTAHNPPSPGFLDICDRMGLLVMDELFDVWTVGKYDDQDYHLYFRDWWRQDETDTVLRDRNHPSVVIYSAGNEIHDNLASSKGQRQFTAMRDLFHQLDPSRPVTMAILRPTEHNIFGSGFADLMDVVGVNYRESELLSVHRARPDYKILGTENQHARPVWLALRDNPACAGQFLWTGIDYLGEADAWPNIAVDFGLLDRAGTIKPVGHQRASWWSTKPMVHIARGGIGGRRGRLGEPRRDSGHVEIYSNCQSVELFLDNQSLGAKTKPADDSPRIWTVAGDAGVLKAIGSNDGKPVAMHELRSSGTAAKLSLTAETTGLPHDFDDVAAVRLTITDADGNQVAAANPLVTFKVTGPGKIAAIDNAAADNHEGFRGSQIHASGGQCCAWVRSTADSGTIAVRASSAGLADGTVTLAAEPPSR
jgi:beta-galactosidase